MISTYGLVKREIEKKLAPAFCLCIPDVHGLKQRLGKTSFRDVLNKRSPLAGASAREQPSAWTTHKVTAAPKIMQNFRLGDFISDRSVGSSDSLESNFERRVILRPSILIMVLYLRFCLDMLDQSGRMSSSYTRTSRDHHVTSMSTAQAQGRTCAWAVSGVLFRIPTMRCKITVSLWWWFPKQNGQAYRCNMVRKVHLACSSVARHRHHVEEQGWDEPSFAGCRIRGNLTQTDGAWHPAFCGIRRWEGSSAVVSRRN